MHHFDLVELVEPNVPRAPGYGDGTAGGHLSKSQSDTITYLVVAFR